MAVVALPKSSTAEEFEEDFFESTSSDGRTLLEHFPSIRWILPSAPERYSTVLQEPMTQPFDIYSLTDPELQQDIQIKGIEESLGWIYDIIKEETQTVPPENILLGGISQGCATALLTFLISRCALAGFIGTAGWLPLDTQIKQVMSNESMNVSDQSPAALLHRLCQVRCDTADSMEDKSAKLCAAVTSSRDSPILLCHGIDDPTIDVSLGRNMRDLLQLLGHTVQWREDADCGHWLKEPEALHSMVEFVSSRGVVDRA